MNHLTVETEDSFSSLHELAANNDVDGFKRSLERDASAINEVGLWYGRQKGSKQMVLKHRTPMMVAATYGSVEVLKLILSRSDADVNISCGPDKSTALHCAASGGSRNLRISITKKKEYPIDPSLPDIKNSIYATDEFRMFSFKVRPCSRAYSHDWTECPFVHPGENARRRDPRKFHYSCVPCPDFRKGACRRGDLCEYAHGVFECWLHPAQYRTRLCKDGTNCARRVCFFAHTSEELRPLYLSTGSAVPSPRASGPANAMDMAAALSLLPGSPSSLGLSLMFLPLTFLEATFSPPRTNAASLSRSARSKTLTPSNLEELFSAEISSSPRYSDSSAVFSPSHKSAILNQFQQQQQSMLMSPRSMEPISPMGPRLSAIAQREKQHQQLRSLSSRDLGSNNPASVVGSPVNSWSKWGSPTGKLDWSVNGDEMGRLKRSSSFELGNNGEEPDLSWVHSLVKESPPEMMKEKFAAPVSASASSGEGLNSNSQIESNSNSQIDSVDHSVIGAWLEQMQLDQLVV
ncbi:unnamed protein product, partial [Vitis vinifera]